MFSHLFSPKNKEGADQETGASFGLVSRMKSFAGRVSLILGLASMSNGAISGPAAPDMPAYDQEVSTMETSFPANAAYDILDSTVLPPKAPILPEQEIGQIEPVSVQPKLRAATAQKWESVGFFMLKNFGTEAGWEHLVEKETGKRVRVATRDLIAGRTYILARDEKEATALTNIFKKRLVKKATTPKVVKNGTAAPDILGIWSDESPVSNSILRTVEGLGLDLNRYLHSISSIESNHTYGVDNVNKGKSLKVDSSKWAFGKYQFTDQTLQAYGISSPKQRSSFLKDPAQQEDIMRRYTLEHIRYIVSEPMFLPLIRAGVQPNHILSAMHHMGAGGVMKIAKNSAYSNNPFSSFFQKLKSSSDWLNTSTYAYVKATSQKYDTTAGDTSPVSYANKKIATASVRTHSDERKPKIMVSAVAANDAQFNEKKPKIVLASLYGTQLDREGSDTIEMEISPSSPMMELIPVGEVQNVAQLFEKEHKAEVMDKLRNDTTIREDVRRSVLAKLEKVTDFSAYYQQNITHYEAEARKGSQYAKHILPSLYKLLWDMESKTMMASNDANISMKRVA